jgi:hypothetical protein
MVAGTTGASAVSTPNLLRSLAQGLTSLGLRQKVALPNVERLSSIVFFVCGENVVLEVRRASTSTAGAEYEYEKCMLSREQTGLTPMATTCRLYRGLNSHCELRSHSAESNLGVMPNPIQTALLLHGKSPYRG